MASSQATNIVYLKAIMLALACSRWSTHASSELVNREDRHKTKNHSHMAYEETKGNRLL